tara:strand:+ start:4710 stop:6071 length:1362 start_codon:yes stop_codon:yes gene_type:complete
MNTDIADAPIFGLSSQVGGAVAIMRCSGKSCLSVAHKLFRSSSKQPRVDFSSHLMNYGFIWDEARQAILDEVYLVYFEAGRSYTGEEMIEIHCHGSTAILQRLSEILRSLGLVPAQPGEFTRKAFLNGRIGLSQAEAVNELIESDNLQQASIAINNVSGGLKSKIMTLRHELVDCAAHLEATLDYPEEDIEFINQDSLLSRINEIASIVDEIYQNYDRFQLSKNGIQVVILGAPNSGKSSLLNALLKKDRAIVTDVEGTTRDHIEENIQINGYKFRIIDTAGLRSTSNKVEQIGIERALEFEKSATLKIYLYDGTQSVNLRNSQDNCIHVLNKMDLDFSTMSSSLLSKSNVIQVSALKLEGLQTLEAWLVENASRYLINKTDLPMLTSERQRDAMHKASESLQSFRGSLQNGIPMDIALVELYEALDYLGQITGKIVTEDIVDRIFEKFCIGK